MAKFSRGPEGKWIRTYRLKDCGREVAESFRSLDAQPTRSRVRLRTLTRVYARNTRIYDSGLWLFATLRLEIAPSRYC